MNLHGLASIKSKTSKRVGRGIGSGLGKTSGRGTKGQKSRSGGKVRIGFEGGQMPLIQRVPKLKGFKSHRPKNQIINFSDLNQLSGQVTKEKLLGKGIIENAKLPVKVLANGKLDKAVQVTVEHISKSAEKEIVQKGGKVTILSKVSKEKEGNNKTK